MCAKPNPVGESFLNLSDVKCRIKSANSSNTQLFLKQVEQINTELCKQRDLLQTELIYGESASELLKEDHTSMLSGIETLKEKLSQADSEAKKELKVFLNCLELKFGSEFMHKLNNLQLMQQELSYVQCVNSIQMYTERIQLGLSTNDFSIVLSSYLSIQKLNSNLETSNCIHLKKYLVSYEKIWRKYLQKVACKFLPLQLVKIGWPFDCVQTIDLKSGEYPKLKDLVALKHITTNNKAGKEVKEPKILDILFEPLRKRFEYHFYGDKPTNVMDKPEWFYTQILKWITTNRVIINKFILPVLEEDTTVDIELVDNLCLLAKHKLQDSYPKVLQDNASFSHLIDETVVFEMEIKALGYLDSCSCLEVLTEERCVSKWIEMERVCNVEKTEQILSQKNAWSLRYGQATQLDEYKVPECTDDFLLLLQLITERYRMLNSPVARCRFVDLQKQLLDDFRVRLVQMSRDPKSAWSSPFPQILNSAAYVSHVISEWSDLPFFIQIQGERMKLKGEDRIEGTFEAMSELFTMLQQQMCKIMLDSMINGECRPALIPYAKEKWFAMDNNCVACQVTSSFCPLLLQVRERFSFLKEALSHLTFESLFRRAVGCIGGVVEEQIIGCTSFNEAGGSQLLYDITNALLPLINSYQVKGADLGKVIFCIGDFCDKVVEKAVVLSLNVGSASLMEDVMWRQVGEEMHTLREFRVFSLTKSAVRDLLKQRVDLVHTDNK